MASIGGFCLRRVCGGSRRALGVVAELDDGHDVQDPVDAPVPGSGQPVASLVAGGRVEGAVPFQDAKWSRLANLLTSPMSPSSRAAPDGPIPGSCCSVLPVDATSSVSCAFAALIFLSMTATSVVSSQASCRRVRPTMSRGRTVLSSARACGADRELLGPAGNEFEQQVVQPAQRLGPGPAQTVTAIDQQLQRNGDIIDHGLTQTVGAQRGHGDAVRVGGVGLRPWAVSNSRACADGFAGTSSTVSPSATRRWAMCRPIPLQPFTAQARSLYCRPSLSTAA
jgi:hypothetical protein